MFTAEINGRLPFQSKSKHMIELQEAGLIEPNDTAPLAGTDLDRLKRQDGQSLMREELLIVIRVKMWRFLMSESNNHFPVHPEDRRLVPGCPEWFPWDLLKAHKGQAEANHSQTLTRLAERGGLGLQEIYCVMHDRRWLPAPSLEISLAYCKEIYDAQFTINPSMASTGSLQDG